MKVRALIFLAALLQACAPSRSVLVPEGEAADPAATARVRKVLLGTWIREGQGRGGLREGIRLDKDGRLGLIGIDSLNGLEWDFSAGALLLTTSSAGNPESDESRLKIKRLEPDRLTLTGEANYLSGIYRRDDAAARRVCGSVALDRPVPLAGNSVVRVVLQDVSKKDAPATSIAEQTLPVAGQSLPLPFCVYYATADIDPGHSYSVHADVYVGGKRLWTSTKPYRVITGRHPAEADVVVTELHRPKPKKRDPRAIVRPTTYRGGYTLPGGGSVRIILNLLPDHSFLLKRERLGQDKSVSIDYDLGHWYAAAGGKQRVLLGRSGDPRKYELIGSRTLRRIDDPAPVRERVPESDVPQSNAEAPASSPVQPEPEREVFPSGYKLTRADRYVAIEDSLPVTGMFSYRADVSSLTECYTEKRFPVAREGDYLTLERAYLVNAGEPGAPVFVIAEGHFRQRPRTKGEGTIETIVVDRFDRMDASARCMPRPQFAELENTHWQLTELNGEPITVPNNTKTPHIKFSPAMRRVVGFDGCSRFAGTLLRPDGRVEVKNIHFTEPSCPSGYDKNERLHRALESVTHYKIWGESLELYSAEGDVVARFEALYFG